MQEGQKKKKTNQPPWKLRLNGKLDAMRKDLSILIEIRENRIKDQRKIDEMERNYKLYNQPIKVKIEQLKQEISVIAHKIEHYATRCGTYRQNKQFKENQKRFYEHRSNTTPQKPERLPNKKDTEEFWSNLCSKPKQHNEDAQWIQKVEVELRDTQVEENLIVPQRTEVQQQER